MTDLEQSMRAAGVPNHLTGGLARYIESHIKPGGFLCAILDNDLMGTIKRMDPMGLAGPDCLPVIIDWLLAEAPSPCWGSAGRVDNWVKRGTVAAEGGQNAQTD